MALLWQWNEIQDTQVSGNDLDHDPIDEYQATISCTVTNHIASGNLLSSASSLIVPSPHMSCFHLLPKVHKQDCPG